MSVAFLKKVRLPNSTSVNPLSDFLISFFVSQRSLGSDIIWIFPPPEDFIRSKSSVALSKLVSIISNNAPGSLIQILVFAGKNEKKVSLVSCTNFVCTSGMRCMAETD